MATKLVDSVFLDDGLRQIANGIRAKTGSSDKLAFPQGFVDGLDNIGGKQVAFVNSYPGDNDLTAWVQDNNYITTRLTNNAANKKIRISITPQYPERYPYTFPIFNATIKYAACYSSSIKLGFSPVATSGTTRVYALKTGTSSSYMGYSNTGIPKYTLIESTEKSLVFDIDTSDWYVSSSLQEVYNSSIAYPTPFTASYWLTVIGE